MPDHIHAPPACGYAPNSPHAPSCGGFSGKMIACGTIKDPGHPNAGQCLCRHEDASSPQAQEAVAKAASPEPPSAAPAQADPAKITKMPAAKPKAKKRKAKAATAKKKSAAKKKKKGRRK